MLRNMTESIKKISSLVTKKAYESEYAFTVLGIFWFFGYIGWYFLWRGASAIGYENLQLRIVASLLGLLLLFHKYWPKLLKSILPLFWYIALLYVVPFFFTFMLLKNNASVVWQLNFITSYVLFILITDWLSVIILSVIGVSLGVIFYYLTTVDPVMPSHIVGISANFFALLLFCGFFLHKKSQIYNEKLQAVQLMAASIAHELRTPLRGFGSSIRRVRETAGKLAASYKIAKEARVAVPEIKAAEVVGFLPLLDGMELGAKSAFTTIEMILMNATTGSSMQQKERYSINECVNEALERYPFDAADRELVHWDEKNSFDIYGDKTAIIHVIFNLLKNALYYTKAAGKGEIYIWLERRWWGFNPLHCLSPI